MSDPTIHPEVHPLQLRPGSGLGNGKAATGLAATSPADLSYEEEETGTVDDPKAADTNYPPPGYEPGASEEKDPGQSGGAPSKEAAANVN